MFHRGAVKKKHYPDMDKDKNQNNSRKCKKKKGLRHDLEATTDCSLLIAYFDLLKV